MAGLKFDITGECVSQYILFLRFCCFPLCFNKLRTGKKSHILCRVCFFV